MKQFFLLSLAFCGFMTAANAQLVVKINDKVVAEGQTVDAASIQKMEVSFSNLKKPKAYSLGKVVLLVEMIGMEDGSLVDYTIVKNGENAIDAFISEPSSFVLYEKDGANDAFRESSSYSYDGKGLKNILKKGTEYTKYNKLRVKASIYFKDKIGYEKYGDAVDLAKAVNFKVTNGINTDGSYNLPMGLKINAAAAEASNYFGFNAPKTFFKLPVPILTNNDVLWISLKKADREYDAVCINEVDCKGKSQDETMASMKKQMDEFLFFTSNICSGARSKLPKMTDEVENGWLQFLRDDNVSCLFPTLNKEENKAWDKAVAMKAATVGKLTGFKFASHFRLANCKDKLEARGFKGHASIFILKHPTDPKKVLIMFNKGNNSSETAETAAAVDAKVEKFIAGLEF
jgi:hypothetical protein